ncbi:MAG: efflux RND transporter periplasmic adaptor subunit [Candidatus Zixiibacteriota bacterium]
MKRSTLFIIFAVIIIGGFFSMMVLFGMKSDVPRQQPKARPKIVSTQVITPKQQVATIRGLGQLNSSQPIDIYSEVEGILIPGNVPFKPAQSFKKGDLLLKVDDRQIRLSLKSAKTNFLSVLGTILAELKSDYAKEYSDWKDYFDNIDIDRPFDELPKTEDKRIQLLLARNNLYNLYFGIQDLEVTLEKHYFYAPFDGSIIATDMRIGATARKGARLGQVVNLEDMEVELQVTIEDISWINIGDKAILKSDEMQATWSGTVRRIGSSINSRTQTISVFIKLDSKNNLTVYDGLYLNVEIPGGYIDKAVVIPRQAIYNDNQVYLIKNGLLETRNVTIARKENDNIILSDGLIKGDTVVVELMQGVVPGMPAQAR